MSAISAMIVLTMPAVLGEMASTGDSVGLRECRFPLGIIFMKENMESKIFK